MSQADIKGRSHFVFSDHKNHTAEFIQQILNGKLEWVVSYRPEFPNDPLYFLPLC
jgi:hypothetical protein